MLANCLIMDYNQTLDYLYTRLPMFSRIGAAAYKADLVNTHAICDFLGNPERKFKSIHIAGTNGKGSTSHMLASILQKAGYKTGLYTSPHLRDFRERIRINGEMIRKDFVVDFTERTRQLAEKLEPSFFELTVGMAFDYFAHESVDIAILETGLGGRLDSTNVVIPEVAVITNISWDHMQLLGDSLEKIAAEKAGIIKKGIPVVVGEVVPETTPIFEEKAAQLHAPLAIAAEQRQATDWHWNHQHLVVEVATQHQVDHKVYELDLGGVYQVKNLLTVLEVCSQLKAAGWKIPDDAIHEGLRTVRKTTGLHGRWETVHSQPAVILDVAHNEDGIRNLVQQIELTDHRELHIIFGMVKDKDGSAALALLPKHARYYFTKANLPRALDEVELQQMAAEAGLNGLTYADVNTALQAALQQAAADDLILVCGSVFLVGEVDEGMLASWKTS